MSKSSPQDCPFHFCDGDTIECLSADDSDGDGLFRCDDCKKTFTAPV